jgi:hypothetical protein
VVERTVEWANKVADAKKNCPKLESKLQEELKELRKKHDAGDCNSFARGTLVLLADGSTKPIEEVELGDRVVATDPEAGESGPQKVVATIVGHGEKNLVEVTVDVDGDAGDAVETITATAEHPFWVDDHGRLLQPAVHGLWRGRAGLV